MRARSCGQKKKRIVWISPLVVDTDVHRTSRLEMLRHLSEIGYETHLFAMRSKRAPANNNGVHVDYVPLRCLPMVQRFLFSVILFLVTPAYALVRKPTYVIVSPGTSIPVLVWKLLLSKCLKSKTILDIRSTSVEKTGWLGHVQDFMFDLGVMFARSVADGFTIITAQMRDEVATRYGISADSFGIWTSGVSTRFFRPDMYSDDARRLREENGLNGKFVVFYHGSLGMRRGIIETVESIDIVKNRCDDVVLFVLGSGAAQPIIQRLIREKGLQGRVMLNDVVDYEEVPRYIAMADVAIVPLPNMKDWIHQCPLKLLEYMAMAKPVVITDIPANRSIVGDSECGIYVRSTNPEDIAEAILYSHVMRDRLSAWGAAGRAIVQERYDWKRVAQCLDEYLTNR